MPLLLSGHRPSYTENPVQSRKADGLSVPPPPLATTISPSPARRARTARQATRLLAAAEQAHALAVEREAYAAETTRLAEARDPNDPGAPFPPLLSLADAIEKAKARWAPRREPAREPPRPGQVRVRVVEAFFDREWMGAKRYPGVHDLDEAIARDVIKKGWAEAV